MTSGVPQKQKLVVEGPKQEQGSRLLLARVLVDFETPVGKPLESFVAALLRSANVFQYR